MRSKKSVTLLCILSVSASLLFGCGEKGPLDGKWAYIHDTENAALEISTNKTVLDGTKYSSSYDNEFITLKDSNGEEKKLRYEMDEKGIYLYKPAEYKLSGEADGLTGLWENPLGWSFEFTDKGTFIEDAQFPGYYTYNEADGSVKLVYNDHFEDTTIYVHIDGDVLNIEYPWRMVRPTKDTSIVDHN